MASLKEIHAQSYSDMPFDEFARRFHARSYSDMPFDDFMKRAGVEQASPPVAGDTSVWGTIKDQAGKAAQATDDVVRMVANGITGGYADKLASFASGSSLEDERAKSEAAHKRAGYAGDAATAVGMLAPAGVASGLVRGISSGAVDVE